MRQRQGFLALTIRRYLGSSYCPHLSNRTVELKDLSEALVLSIFHHQYVS
jgi:hypothetical protein